jgi:signal transduction histidine kinase
MNTTIEQERIADPIKDEYRMSCMNALLFIDHFVQNKNIPLKTLLQGVTVEEKYFRNSANWLNNINTFRLYRNAHYSIPNFTHKDWKKVGQEIQRKNSSGYFKIIVKMVPIKHIYRKIPDYNKRLTNFSKYTIISESRESTIFKYEITNPKIRSHYSIGSECWYHLGILETLPKLQAHSNKYSSAEHEICSMKLENILSNCYKVSGSRCGYSKAGFTLDNNLVGKWICLKSRNDYPEFLSSQYDLTSRENANAIVVTEDIYLDHKHPVFNKGEIYNAPYCIFQVNFNKQSFFQRFLNRQKISLDYLEEQLLLTEEKFKEAEALRLLSEKERERAEKAESKVREYADSLEELVSKRTRELEIALNQAENANQVKSDFLSKMSHELRTPMQSILGFSRFGVAKIDQGIDGKSKEYFSIINESGNRLLKLLDNLLDLSKMEAGKITYEYKQASMSSIINIVITELASLVKKNNITIIFEEPEFDDSMSMDNEKIMQVIRNLLSNSIKFSHNNEQIEIKVDKSSENLTVSVVDKGVGIPPEETILIFEKFTQSSKTKTNAGGTGLGLAICKEIIQAHNGKIWAENNPKGGATFSFMLPYEQNS